jgi:hypothetical protein
MSEEAGAKLRRRVPCAPAARLENRRSSRHGRIAIAAVVWAIVSGRDVAAIVGDLLTFMTLVAAVVALRYAAQSAQAARDTVGPMQAMASDLAAAAKTMHTNVQLAELSRRERQYERVHAELVRWLLADHPAEAREGRACYVPPFPHFRQTNSTHVGQL